MNEDTVEKALKYLAETDQSHANAKALVKALENGLKVARSVQFLKADGTMAEKEAKSYASSEYLDANEKFQDAWADFQLLENKRERAVLTIDVWRSLNSARTKGVL